MMSKKMSTISILATLVLLSTLAALNAQNIQVTVTTVNQDGNTLNGGEVSVHDPYSGWSTSGDSPLIYTQPHGGIVRIGGIWGGLKLMQPGHHWIQLCILEGTTYYVDVLDGELMSEVETPGVTRVNLVFVPMDVTLTTVDQNGNPLLDGHVGTTALHGGWNSSGDSPHSYEQANGGVMRIGGVWGGLKLIRPGGHWIQLRILKNTTYNVDVLTGELVSEVETPGVTRVNLVFVPMDVTLTTVDQNGNPLLDGHVGTTALHGGWNSSGDSPHSYEQANGGVMRIGGVWGGLKLIRPGGHWIQLRILRDTTYNVDVLSGELVSEVYTLGENRVNLVFEPIDVTVATVNQDGMFLDGHVTVTCPGYWNITGDSPLTYEQANGAVMRIGGYWDGRRLNNHWVGVRILKDTTYSIVVPNGETTSASTFGVNRVNIVFITDISATVDIDPDVLNLKSKGKWITGYIELPEGYDVGEIDVGTVLLNDVIPAESKPAEVGDYDNDGIADLMVKFDRSAVEEMLEAGDEVEITVTGEVTRIPFIIPFEGSDAIRVID